MAKVIKDKKELDDVLKTQTGKTFVLDFFAHWCSPCMMVATKLTEFHRVYPNVLTLTVDVDRCMDLAEKYKVHAMPTFKVIRRGRVVETLVGGDLQKLEEIYRRYNARAGCPVEAVPIGDVPRRSG